MNSKIYTLIVAVIFALSLVFTTAAQAHCKKHHHRYSRVHTFCQWIPAHKECGCCVPAKKVCYTYKKYCKWYRGGCCGGTYYPAKKVCSYYPYY